MEIEVTDASFEKEVIERSKKIPVLVDFWAGWCGPCMMLKPTLEKLSKEFEGKMILAKVDVQENQEKAGDFEVMSIPSVKLFKDGKITDEFVGVQPEEMLRKWLKQKL
jgi:putative thioredoxin